MGASRRWGQLGHLDHFKDESQCKCPDGVLTCFLHIAWKIFYHNPQCKHILFFSSFLWALHRFRYKQ